MGSLSSRMISSIWRRAEAIDEDVFGDLGHIAAVGSLVKDDVDVLKGGSHG